MTIGHATLGARHPDVALSHNSLAQSMIMHGSDAEGADKHPDVATGLNNVGYLRMHLGELGQARQLLERALALGEATNGPEHRSTAAILESLGELSLPTPGDLPAARTYLERALAIFQKQVDPAAYDTALAQVVLARVLVAQGQLDRAGTLFEFALAANDKTGCLGSEASKLYEGYADYLKRRGRTADAARFEARAREAKEKTAAVK